VRGVGPLGLGYGRAGQALPPPGVGRSAAAAAEGARPSSGVVWGMFGFCCSHHGARGAAAGAPLCLRATSCGEWVGGSSSRSTKAAMSAALDGAGLRLVERGQRCERSGIGLRAALAPCERRRCTAGLRRRRPGGRATSMSLRAHVPGAGAPFASRALGMRGRGRMQSDPSEWKWTVKSNPNLCVDKSWVPPPPGSGGASLARGGRERAMGTG
jgi:hypothetical protein